MNDNNWRDPEEMKKIIGSTAKAGDYRILHEAVKKGTIEVKEVTDRKKVYRFKTEEKANNDNNVIDLDFSEAA